MKSLQDEEEESWPGESGYRYGLHGLFLAKRDQLEDADEVAYKHELNRKLEEFASYTDNLEEVFENPEQIEISKFFERLPKPSLISLQELGDDQIYFRINETPEVEETAENEIDYEEYELPEDFKPPEKDEIPESEKNWFQRQMTKLRDMENTQRLYWIKILSGCIIGVILGLFGAKTGWWLFLMIGVYAGIAAGGFFLFKLEWNWKEILFNGFFPYLALFTLFWVLMFTSLYGPPMSVWLTVLETTITTVVNGTEVTSVVNRSTSAAGFPYVSILLTIVGTLGLMSFLLRRQKRRERELQ